ncbi:uncharacterized protein LOC132038362 [Lycium ferocissimum]|uniref:uncharacterized protein LOC132038362 n=1 Tax=Lycium ferocissimum TaxID=112874 RepID=UPI002814987C|nr:uncharacterized protein LOC132038362 [Lycium ferocissimum]XP_059285026.1 uncharacterized protein LOC132038362 [Lycium ferocissimum]
MTGRKHKAKLSLPTVDENPLGKEQRAIFENELNQMNVSTEDLIKMLEFNCETKLVEGCNQRRALIKYCTYGMAYGAIKSKCPKCGSMIIFDGVNFSCHRNAYMKSTCEYARYKVKHKRTPWKIPKTVDNEQLKRWKKDSENIEQGYVLKGEKAKNRDKTLKEIQEHKKIMTNNTTGKCILVEKDIVYSYFLVPTDDFEKFQYIFGQVQYIPVLSEQLHNFVFFSREKVCKVPQDMTDEASGPIKDRDYAIRCFCKKFLDSTGNTWEEWLEGSFVRMPKKFFPLKIDYFTKLDFAEIEDIEDFQEQMVVNLDDLKTYRIRGELISRELIETAKDITQKKIENAHEALTELNKLTTERSSLRRLYEANLLDGVKDVSIYFFACPATH